MKAIPGRCIYKGPQAFLAVAFHGANIRERQGRNVAVAAILTRNCLRRPMRSVAERAAINGKYLLRGPNSRTV